jgi:hypothetical protein
MVRFAASLVLIAGLLGCGGGGGGTPPPPPNPNPVPTLTSISPTSAAVGGPAFTLTVNGSKFISSSVVRWGGQNRTTTFGSSTQLTASISASDIATVDTVAVTVFNPSPGGGTSNSLNIAITVGPTISSLEPANAFAGGRTFALTVNGANFIDTSVVRWNGSDRITTFSSSTMLVASIPESDIASPGTASVTVFNPGPGGGESSPFTYSVLTAAPLVITTSSLPDTTGGKTYDVTLASTGGVPPITWAITSGSLPAGSLTLDSATGRIAGTVNVVGSDTTSSFTVQATDSSATPQQDSKPLGILVKSSALASNDTCPAGATPISNGRIRASISPYGDIDVYSFSGTGGTKVTIEIFAQRLDLDNNPTTRDSHLDSIIELLDNGCTPLAVNDDIDPGIIQDSRISVSSTPFPPACPPPGPNWYPCGDIPPPTSLPYTGTYYIRVRDLRGDGRPDLIYELSLSGAN